MTTKTILCKSDKDKDNKDQQLDDETRRRPQTEGTLTEALTEAPRAMATKTRTRTRKKSAYLGASCSDAGNTCLHEGKECVLSHCESRFVSRGPSMPSSPAILTRLRDGTTCGQYYERSPCFTGTTLFPVFAVHTHLCKQHKFGLI